MLLLLCLFIPVVIAALDQRTTKAPPTLQDTEQLRVNGYVINIDNNILKFVEKSPQSSENLDLSGRNLVGIDRKAFNDLSNVKNLNLSNNLLKNLPQLVFLPLENLEYLSLANNPFNYNTNFLVGLEKLKTLDVTNINETFWNRDSYVGLFHSTIVLNGSRHLTVPASPYKNGWTPYILLCINNDIVKSVKLADDIENLRAVAKNCERADLLDYYLINKFSILSLRKKSIIGFEEGWYNLESLSIRTLDLAANNITRVTNSMLDHLPKNLADINLRCNEIDRLHMEIITNKNLHF